MRRKRNFRIARAGQENPVKKDRHPSHNRGTSIGVASSRKPQRRWRLDGVATTAVPAGTKPRWDCRARELWYGNVLVKRLHGCAKNADLILAVFEEEGWPSGIDDPLPFDPAVESRARLKRAIHHLNCAQENSIIRFHGNGRGDGIRWEYIGS